MRLLKHALAALLALPLASAQSFTYNNSTFLLDGEPFQIIGGQMDPQRIPAVYWRDRLSKARAMGLNTVFSYVYWNLMEPSPGDWRGADPNNDIARYFQIAQEEGLQIILRPGPYICGEREWGGFPAWLSTVDGLVVRSSNAPFLAAATRYLARLAATLRDSQATRGGPLLMVQVENEYGSYGADHAYTAALRDVLRAHFDVPLYTNDGGVDWTLAGGSVPGVLAEIDGDPTSGFEARAQHITDPSMLGPLLDGEYYTLAPDFWGTANVHNTTVGRPDTVAQFIKDLDFVLGSNASISLYMFHGGTNFGFSAGALWRNRTDVFTTSYDYGAPLDESGRTTDLYFTLRDTIQKYVPAGNIPDVPADLPRSTIPNITLTASASLFDVRGNKTSAASPMTMEALGQAYGFVLYEHTATSAATGVLQPGDRARDRVLVYVNGVRQGVVDSTKDVPGTVSLALAAGDTLQLLVENLGRVDYYSLESGVQNMVLDPHKGVVGNVTVGGAVLAGWDMYAIPLDEVPNLHSAPARSNSSGSSVPRFFRGSFTAPATNTSAELDTFLAVPTGVKGNVWVNGFNLGRYWIVGPQQSLYLPGAVIKPGAANEVVVLELSPNGDTLVANGSPDRVWANYPDPDG